MRVDLIAPVRLSARPALDVLLERDLAAVCTRLSAVTGVATDSAQESRPGIISEHQPRDTVLLPRYLCRGPVDLAAVDESVRDVIRSAELAVTPYGLGMIGLVLEIDDAEALGPIEERLCEWVSDVARAFVHDFRSALRELDLLVEEPRGIRSLPQDTFLWWHRVLEVMAPPHFETVSSLDRFPERSLRPGTRLRVGDGYSLIETDSEEERGQLLEGLHAATQIWLVTDRLQRQLAEQTMRLHTAVKLTDRELHDEQSEALRVCEQTMLESQLLLEEQRYSAGARRQALEAASESWRMPLDLRGLFDAADAVRDIVDRRVQQRREEQADRLNRLLAALTLVTALSIVLLIFETAVGLEPEFFVGRLIVAAVVAVTTIASVTYVWRRT